MSVEKRGEANKTQLFVYNTIKDAYKGGYKNGTKSKVAGTALSPFFAKPSHESLVFGSRNAFFLGAQQKHEIVFF